MDTSTDNVFMVLVGVLTLLYCTLALAWVYFASRRRAHAAAHAGQLKLVAVIFSADGAVLTTAEGALPSRPISINATPSQLISHIRHDQPAFLSTQLLTNDWTLADGIIGRLALEHSRHRASLVPAQDVDPLDDSRLVGNFKRKFVEATYSLARELDLPLFKIGSLFDRVVPITDPTVTEGKPGHVRGVMLVLVSRLADSGPNSASRFRASGYRFTEPARVVAPILKHLTFLTPSRLETLLAHFAAYVDRFERCVVYEANAVRDSLDSNLTLQVYITVQAKREGDDGEEMLVCSSARQQTPIWRLSGVELTDDIRNWFDGQSSSTLGQVARACAGVVEPSIRPATSLSPARSLLPMQRFLLELSAALDGVKDLIEPTWPGCINSFRLAQFEQMRIGGRRKATIVVFTGTLAEVDSGPTSFSPFAPVDLYGHAFTSVASYHPAHWLQLDGPAAADWTAETRRDLDRMFQSDIRPDTASSRSSPPPLFDEEKGTPDEKHEFDFAVSTISPVLPGPSTSVVGSPISVIRSSLRHSIGSTVRMVSPDLIPLSPVLSRGKSGYATP